MVQKVSIMKYNCIIILGPTASGKTAISINLAKQLNGEIINADSQQIIRGLNIGTAKITEKEKQGVPHHLFDIINIGEDFSVSEYQKHAEQKIKEILSRKKLPIIVGGTGFYINSLLYKYTFGNADKNDTIREKYELLSKENGNEYVYNILKDLDIESAKKLHPNDLKRVIRAIEIALTGNKKSDQQLIKNDIINPYIIYLELDRCLLYQRINNRVDKMMEDGLIVEIDKLYKDGYYNSEDNYKNLPIGYSEWSEFYNNNIDKKNIIEKIKQNSRHYAKRQITWFKKVENNITIKIDNNTNIDKITKDIINDINKKTEH